MRNQPWNADLPQNQPRTRDELKEHLLANRFITEDGCWEWLGNRSKSGYGKIKWKGRHLRVHRMAAFLWLGFDLDDTHLICHHCDNPLCFNPKDLFVGTSQDNQLDSVRKGRHHLKSQTQCKHGHEFTPENTWIEKSGYRHCRTCHRNTENARNARRRVSQ